MWGDSTGRSHIDRSSEGAHTHCLFSPTLALLTLRKGYHTTMTVCGDSEQEEVQLTERI
jgi:hypothetical protein